MGTEGIDLSQPVFTRGVEGETERKPVAVIALDLDNVIRATTAYLAEKLTDKYPEMEDILNAYEGMDLRKAIPPERPEIANWFEENFFEITGNAPPVPGSIEEIKDLIKSGFKVHVVTTQEENQRLSLIEWLTQVGLSELASPERLHLVSLEEKKRKDFKHGVWKKQVLEKINALVFVEDIQTIAEDAVTEENGPMKVVILTMPWNQNSPYSSIGEGGGNALQRSVIRQVKSWEETRQVIERTVEARDMLQSELENPEN